MLVDGSAAWCHWCHVMDATTYADPAVAERVAARFVAVRFDAEERLDSPHLLPRVGLARDRDPHRRWRGGAAAQGLPSPSATSSACSTARSRAPAPAPTHPWRTRLPTNRARHRGPWIARSDALRPRARVVGHRRSRSGSTSPSNSGAAHGDADDSGAGRGDVAAQRALYDPVWGGVYQYAEGRSQYRTTKNS